MNEPSFEYPMMVPDRAYPAFGEMTSKESRSYFNWFVGTQSDRISVLRRAFTATSGGAELSLTESSLMPLWDWMVPRICCERRFGPLPTLTTASEASDQRLSVGTLALAVDAGFYLSELIQRRCAAVTWSLWERTRDYYFQRPVLIGLGRHPVVPHDPVVAGCWRVVRKQSSQNELQRIFRAWEKKVTSRH